MAKSKNTENRSEFIIFKTEDEKISVDVRMNEQDVWLTQDQLAMLYGVERPGITQHIKNILAKANCKKIQLVRNSYELPQTVKNTIQSTITLI